MKILAICNTADRTGKTTSAIQLAAAKGLSGQRTLVIDLDPAAWLSKRMGAFVTNPSDSSVALFERTVDLGALTVHEFNGFGLLPATAELRMLAQSLNKTTDVFRLKEALSSIQGYDLVILDTPGGFRTLILNALVVAHALLIPVTPGIHAIESGEHTCLMGQQVKARLNPDLKSAHFLRTIVKSDQEDTVLSRIRKQYSSLVLESVVRSSTILSLDKKIVGRTVFDISMHARGAIDYANVADELDRQMDSQRLNEKA